jgi:hypothetical protein
VAQQVLAELPQALELEVSVRPGLLESRLERPRWARLVAEATAVSAAQERHPFAIEREAELPQEQPAAEQREPRALPLQGLVAPGPEVPAAGQQEPVASEPPSVRAQVLVPECLATGGEFFPRRRPEWSWSGSFSRLHQDPEEGR